MDVPSHAEVVELIDAFLDRHAMAPSRLGRDALGESQFVLQVRAGRTPSLQTLLKLRDFMRERDEALVIVSDDAAADQPRHRLSASIV